MMCKVALERRMGFLNTNGHMSNDMIKIMSALKGKYIVHTLRIKVYLHLVCLFFSVFIRVFLLYFKQCKQTIDR